MKKFYPRMHFNHVGITIESHITPDMARRQRQFVNRVVSRTVGRHQGMYLVLEGLDLTGKTSQCYNLLRLLRDNSDLSIQLVDEPGGTERADEIRRLVKNKDNQLTPQQNIELFTEARQDLFDKVIAPALSRGEIVIADRNWWSTIAYQGFGQGVSVDEITECTSRRLPERYLRPDAGVIMMTSESVQAERRRLRTKDDMDKEITQDAFEDADDENFMTKVADGYRYVSKQFDVPIVDASANEMEVFDRVLDALLCQLN